MNADDRLHQRFGEVPELLDGVREGTKAWDDFWQPFAELRALLSSVDDSLRKPSVPTLVRHPTLSSLMSRA
jgi:hypothetical protein